MATIRDKEDNLKQRWLASYGKEEQKQFCFDGLLLNKYEDPDGEIQRWETNERKVLFLLKDTNRNPDSDTRNWELFDYPGYRVHKTYVVLLKWLWALNEVSKDNLPKFDKPREEYIELANKYPMAVVNIKKISGVSKVAYKTVKQYAERDAAFLREQIHDILKPTIIVCGGTFKLLKEYLCPDYEFVKYNDLCYYCKDKNLLVLDCYHPAAIVSDYVKFDCVAGNVQDFLLKLDK